MQQHLKNLEEHAREALKPAIQGQLSPAERIALYKRFLKTEEHRILQHHRAGAGGLEVARARAQLIDTIIRSILEASINARKSGELLPIALVATGGYGRGTLNPSSDIDILFLLPGPRPSCRSRCASSSRTSSICYGMSGSRSATPAARSPSASSRPRPTRRTRPR